MNTLSFALIGLGAGAAYVLIAQGIVLIYRGSGVLNFSQGAVAMITAQVFYQIRDNWGWPTPLALVVALLLSAAIGAAMQWAVLRRLKNASALARVMATLGLFALAEGLGTIWWGTYSQPVTGFLPTAPVHFTKQLVLSEDRIYLLGISVALTALLWLVYQRTRFGLATSAVAENERAAVFLGWSPALISTWNWVIGSVLAGVAGILLAPITGLSVDVLTLSVIPGLAAALVGRFSSFWLTLGGALGISVIQSEVVDHVQTPGWSESVPFMVIIVLVVVRGRALPLRGEFLERPVRVGRGTFNPRLLIAATVVAGVLVHFMSNSWALAVCTSALLGIAGLSLVVVTGYAGQISLAQLTIAGIGASSAGVASSDWGLPFPVAVVFAVVVAVGVGFIAGLPALRCRGANLAIVTVGLSLLIEQLVLPSPTLAGVSGGLTVQTPTLFGLNINFTQHPVKYTIFVCVVFIVCAVCVANIRRGQTGRQLLAIRSNERAAASAGVNVFASKLYAFSVGAGLAGLSGALTTFQFPQTDLSQYTTTGSITMVVNVVTGGIGYIGGAINEALLGTGGVFSRIVSYLPGGLGTYLSAISGASVLFILVTHPQGFFDAIFDKLPRSRRSRNSPGDGGIFSLASEAGPRETIISANRSGLRLRELSVSFGPRQVLRQINLDVQPGEVVGMIGPNGAGKSTIIDSVCGMVKSSGSIRLGEVDLARRSPHRRTRAGLGRTFQTVELFDDLTVLDNIRTASDQHIMINALTDLVRPRSRPLPAIAQTAVRELELVDDLQRYPDELPSGHRRIVGIARALAAAPGVLLLDEPAAGLNDRETAELAHLVRRLADEWGLAILLVEHDVPFVCSVSDRVVALSLGAIIAEGPPGEVMTNPAVIAAYIGVNDEPADEAADAGEAARSDSAIS